MLINVYDIVARYIHSIHQTAISEVYEQWIDLRSLTGLFKSVLILSMWLIDFVLLNLLPVPQLA